MYAYLFFALFYLFNFAYSLDPAWNNLNNTVCLVVIQMVKLGLFVRPKNSKMPKIEDCAFKTRKMNAIVMAENTVEISDGEFDCENAEMSSSTNFNGEYGGRKRRSSFQMDPYENKADADPRVVVGDDIEISGSQIPYSQCPGTSTDSFPVFNFCRK